MARTLRRNQTDAEKLLWSRLRNRGLLGAKFRRQCPIGPFFADFACMDAHLVIELDGGHHMDRREEDAARTDYIKAQGFRVLRFWNIEVLENLGGVVEVIGEALEGD